MVYLFTAAHTGDHIFAYNPTSGPYQITVTTGGCDDLATQCLGNSGDLFFGGDLTVSLTEGTDYYVILDGVVTGDEGEYTLEITEP